MAGQTTTDEEEYAPATGAVCSGGVSKLGNGTETVSRDDQFLADAAMDERAPFGRVVRDLEAATDDERNGYE